MNEPKKLTVADWQTLVLPVLVERLREIMEELDAETPPPASPAPPTVRATFRG